MFEADDPAPGGPNDETSATAPAEALAAITGRDPAFDLDAFLAEAVQTYLLVDRARTTGDVGTVRAHVGQAAWAQLGLDGAGGHPAPADEPPHLGQLEVVQARTDDAFDSIVVRIPVSRAGQRHVQDWCFQRSATARTETAGDAAVCPNCGAPRSVGPDGNCRYCDGPLSGVGDGWTVTRVAEVDPGAGRGGWSASEVATAVATLMTAAQQARESGAGDASVEARRAAAQAAARTPAARARGCGCLTFLALIVLVPAGLSIYAVARPGSGIHATGAKLLPAFRQARLHGQLTFTGASVQDSPFAVWWPKHEHCDNLATKSGTAVIEVTKPDGTLLRVRAQVANGLFFEPGRTLTQRNVLIVPSVEAKPPAGQTVGPHQVWSAGPAAQSSLVVAGDGSGQLSFTNYVPTLSEPGAPSGPLSGTVRWTCKEE